MLRQDALEIWQHAVDAVRPAKLMPSLSQDWHDVLRDAERIIVVGGGKAAAGMAQALEHTLGKFLDRVEGLVNIPEGTELPTQRIRLHPARPAGSNHPTEAGVRGTAEMLELVQSCGLRDVAIVLLSGGGSALLPLPIESITLQQKQQITALLHEAGATITEMNTVRKHLSRIKGGRLAEAFHGKRMLSLIISDVVGNPLDVIASGPTTADSSTLDDVQAIMNRYELKWKLLNLEETPKTLSDRIENRIIGCNAVALQSAEKQAKLLGYDNILNLGSFVQGESQASATLLVGVVRSIITNAKPFASPCCILFGGETTVDLEGTDGKGGRNQEWVLAALDAIPKSLLNKVCLLSGGTDGEDGPTDAAGAVADFETWQRTERLNLVTSEYLKRHDSYAFFDRTESLIRCGLTGTNVMDVGVILIR